MKRVCLITARDSDRDSWIRLLAGHGYAVAVAAARAEEVDWTSPDLPDLILVDLADPAEQVAALGLIRAGRPAARAVLFVAAFEADAMLRCLQAGACGYFVKDRPAEQLMAGLELAAVGETVIPSRFADLLLAGRADPAAADSGAGEVELSPRELAVLAEVAAGRPNKVIARQLAVSEAAIKLHLQAIFRKLKVANRTQAAMWAAAHGCRPPPR